MINMICHMAKNYGRVVDIFTSDILHIEECNGIPYMKFKIFDDMPWLHTAISTRHGGVSQGGCAGLNLGTSTVDSMDNVVRNYEIFCNAAGFDINRIVLAKQTHSANVMVADESHAGCGVLRERHYDNVDALVTSLPNLPLVIHTADCVPVAFADGANHVIGNAHCGWRGTFAQLAKVTLDKMHDLYGTKPCDVKVAIGPCICVDCYEVSEELYRDFLQKFAYDKYIICNHGKYYLNLPMINRQILIDCGVPLCNIAVADVCSCCNSDDLFSHRGIGPERGILGSFVCIKE